MLCLGSNLLWSGQMLARTTPEGFSARMPGCAYHDAFHFFCASWQNASRIHGGFYFMLVVTFVSACGTMEPFCKPTLFHRSVAENNMGVGKHILLHIIMLRVFLRLFAFRPVRVPVSERSEAAQELNRRQVSNT